MARKKKKEVGYTDITVLDYIYEPRKGSRTKFLTRHGSPISAGQIMRLIGLTLRSSLSEEYQTELIDILDDLRPHELPELIQFLEMQQLDLTQLSVYTKEDINKRLDYIDKQEKTSI